MATTTQQPATPVIEVDGTAVSDALFERLGRLTVDVRLDRTGVTTLEFADPGYELFDREPAICKVGAKVRIWLPDHNHTPQEVMSGYVTAVGVEQSEARAIPTIVVEVRGPDHVLARTTVIASYLEMAHADILQKVAGRHGWKLSYTGTGQTKPLPYLLQSGTEAELLDMLARPYGYEWFVRDDTLIFQDRQDVAGPTLDDDTGLLRFSAHFQAETTASDVTLHGWDTATHREVTGTAKVADFADPQQVGSDAEFVVAQQRAAFTSFTSAIELSTPLVLDQDEATATAEGFAKRMLRSGLHAEGLALATPDIVVGSFVTVKGVGRRLSGRYFVTRVVHEFTPGKDTHTRFMCDPAAAAASGVGAMTGARVGGGAAGEPSHISHPNTGPVAGFGRDHLVIGKVTNVKDPEKLARVKVKFPGLGGADESAWARLVLPGAGPDRGLDVRPEIDDEVLVAFVQGDPRAPVVLGGVFSGRNAPTFVQENNNGIIQRALRTRVGHELVLADGKEGTAAGSADRHVKVALADGKTSVLVGEDRIKIEAPRGNPISLVSGGASLTITAGGDLEIKAKNVAITADNDIKVSGLKVDMAAKTTMKLDGKASFEAKGGATAKLEASGPAIVKGAIVQIN